MPPSPAALRRSEALPSASSPFPPGRHSAPLPLLRLHELRERPEVEMNHVREIDPHGIARRPATLLHGVGHALELASTEEPEEAKRRHALSVCRLPLERGTLGRERRAGGDRRVHHRRSSPAMSSYVRFEAWRYCSKRAGFQISM